jgi:hypothetical protein
MIRIASSQTPLPAYDKITYHPGFWLLHKTNGEQIKYERAFIGFEGGIFILLTLTGISRQKSIVIFNDQITMDQYRVLKLIYRKDKKRKNI